MSKAATLTIALQVAKDTGNGTTTNVVDPPYSASFNVKDTEKSGSVAIPNGADTDILVDFTENKQLWLIPEYDDGVTLSDQKMIIKITLNGPTNHETLIRRGGLIALPANVTAVKARQDTGAAATLVVSEFEEV